MAMYIWAHDEWPQFLTWDAASLLEPLAEAVQANELVKSSIRSVGLSQTQELHAFVDEAVATSAIEGERIDPESVRSSIAKRLGIETGGLAAKSERSVEGLVDVLTDATRNHEAKLTEKTLCGWQAALFPTGHSGIRAIEVGRFRSSDDAMQVVSRPLSHVPVVHFEAPPSGYVPHGMDTLLRWWAGPSGIHGLLRAAVAHFWFVTIHPFEDGNGRIARALSDMALAQYDGERHRYFSMSKAIREDRAAYYAKLEAAQRGKGDITEWIEWFLTTYCGALQNTLSTVGDVRRRTEFWRTNSTAELNPRQRKVIAKMVDAGPGNFDGGMTNRKFVAIAKTTRPTARRDLAELVSMGILTPGSAQGRSAFYELVWPQSRA